MSAIINPNSWKPLNVCYINTDLLCYAQQRYCYVLWEKIKIFLEIVCALKIRSRYLYLTQAEDLYSLNKDSRQYSAELWTANISCTSYERGFATATGSVSPEWLVWPSVSPKNYPRPWRITETLISRCQKYVHNHICVTWQNTSVSLTIQQQYQFYRIYTAIRFCYANGMSACTCRRDYVAQKSARKLIRTAQSRKENKTSWINTPPTTTCIQQSLTFVLSAFKYSHMCPCRNVLNTNVDITCPILGRPEHQWGRQQVTWVIFRP